jgi:hypothetical protein
MDTCRDLHYSLHSNKLILRFFLYQHTEDILKRNLC